MGSLVFWGGIHTVTDVHKGACIHTANHLISIHFSYNITMYILCLTVMLQNCIVGCQGYVLD